MTLKDNEILYFLHIPKTAGTSLIKVLDDQFDHSEICPEEKWSGLISISTEKLSKYKLLRGHFGFNVNSIFPQKPIYITMIRNPMERTLSSYEHIKRQLAKSLDLEIFSGKNELEDFIKDPKTRGVFTNTQVRHIGLNVNIKSILNDNENKIKNFYFQYSNFFINPNLNDDTLLDIAKRRLLDFSFVGIVEKFEESLMLLCYTFGWRPIPYVPKERITINRIENNSVSNKLMEQIKHDVVCDIELYDFTLKLFEKRFSNMVTKLKEKYLTPELEKLSFGDMMFNMLEKHHESYQNNSRELISSIDYNFSQSLYGAGWHNRQVKPDTEVIFRWTGPETTSTIYFPLQCTSDLKIEIHIINSLYNDILDSFKLKINNFNVKLELKKDDGARIFDGIIPKSIFKNNSKLIKLTFEINRTTSPYSKNPKFHDKRMVGLAFKKIKIIPINK